jgi:hypothetical protein
MFLSGTLVLAQEDPLPEKVNNSFYAKYPKADYVSWYADDFTCRIDFEIVPDNYTATYTKDGAWLETSQIISDQDIPQAVLSVITGQYPESELSYAEYIENNNNEKYYRINVYSENAFTTISLTGDGKILTKEEE